MAEVYDVIVVGGGPGGLVCGSLLAKDGLNVLLVEKNATPGGKFVTFSRNGFKYDCGPHGRTPSEGHGFDMAFKALGIESMLKPIALDGERTMAISYRHRAWDKYRTMVMSGEGDDVGGQERLFDLWGLSTKESESALAIMADMVLVMPEQLEALDDLSVEEFLSRYEVPHGLSSYFGLAANVMMAVPIENASASEQAMIMQDIAVGGGGGYYEGGIGSVSDALAEAFVAHGGEIRFGIRAEKIRVEDGEVRGVVLEDGEARAPIVVSNAGIQPTVLKLVGEEHFDREYVDYVKDLTPSWGFTAVAYQLSKPVMQHATYLMYSDEGFWNLDRYKRVREGHMPEEVIAYFQVLSNFDPTMAPVGKQSIIAGTICPSDPNASEISMLCSKMDELINNVYPEMMDAVESKAVLGPAEVSSLTRDHVLPGQGGGVCWSGPGCRTMRKAYALAGVTGPWAFLRRIRCRSKRRRVASSCEIGYPSNGDGSPISSRG